MRFRFYKTKRADEFWAVRMNKKDTPKMVPGKHNFAYGILPTNDPEGGYTAGEIDLDWLSLNACRCLRSDALKCMGAYAYLVTDRGVQFRHSVSSGVYAIVTLREGKPIPTGEHKKAVAILRGVQERPGLYMLVDSFVCLETLHLDKVVSANVARKYDPVFVQTILEKYAAFTA